MNEMRKGFLPLAVVAVVAGVAREAAAQEDPGALGPLAVTTTEYVGDTFQVGDPPTVVEFVGKIHRPTNLTSRYPLVLFLHGQHAPCSVVASGTPSSDWPCTDAGLAPVPSYRGYDYVARTLASHGMIVASINANGINAADADGGLRIAERRELLQAHISAWVQANNTGGGFIGSGFVGKVDLSRIATVGHSRGGQAVLSHAAESAPAGLRAVLAIAPTGSGTATPLSNLPLGILLGYCDGDQDHLNGARYFDKARYAVAADSANKYTFLGLTANHNYFNSVWGPSSAAGEDDWDTPEDADCGDDSDRLSESEQQGFGRAYIAAFLRKHLLGATEFDSILNGDALPPPSAQTPDVYVGYLPRASDRKDLNRLLTSGESTTNTLGGAVSVAGLTATPCGASPRCVVNNGRQTHWPNSSALAGTRIEWAAANGTYTNELPVFKRDVSNFATLQFRVAVDYTDTDNTAGIPQDFSIRLLDSGGSSSTLRASDYSDVLYYPPGEVFGTTDNRAAVMNSLRVPLEAFANVDLTSVASVVLLFDKTSKGRVIVSDIAFADEGISAAEKWLVSENVPF